MRIGVSHVGRLLISATVGTLAVCGIPCAHGVTPPPVDETRLPAAAPPAPPRPTVQREICAVATAEARRADLPAQLADLDLPRIWRLTRGAGQRIAVIDTGVSRHRRLPRLVAGGDYVFTGDGTQDCDAHGTIVAGIIAAAEDSDQDKFSGVAPEATVISIRQSSVKFAPVDERSSGGVGDVATMAQAVRTAADLGASVINISPVACVPASAALDDRALGAALAYAVDVKNAVIVSAAGSTEQCAPQRLDASSDTAELAVSPAWYDDYVLTVGSVDADGAPSAFTVAGPWVDVAATGENVTSLNPIGDGIANSLDSHHGATPLAGTGYAAPVVSGLAGLIRARFPALTARQVMARIKSTAHHPPGGWNPIVGNGIVDALAAISTESAPPTVTATTGRETGPVPITAPARSPSADRRARDAAVHGSVVCLVVLVAAAGSWAARGSARRSRRRGRPGPDGVVGH
ncbi:Thermophilic serine proteinase precursor [Mycobacterium basiliense]|uniref:Thermophilic serine proteinase n=1 Tax=Mycobacterium basiliense TaxID=2094119 RepID=A0A3S4C9H0_9MYCO|nr:type VII secretion-associated serine protease mycosin [Mycobacterium basiliense]VDM87423.1 Thermophilic serine proteinase precursor [Mycobacterium basiliense]